MAAVNNEHISYIIIPKIHINDINYEICDMFDKEHKRGFF